MLKLLSGKFQKTIATFLLSIFYLSGLAALRAEANYSTGNPTGTNAGARNTDRFYPVTTGRAENMFRSGVRDSLDNSNRKSENPRPSALKEVTPDKDEVIEEMLRAPLIGGPGQPEMSSFKPVGADNMVSPFTGDFSYNIPLLDVGGYPVNIFYNSGITMDQEASWVGLGWNINPGTVSRNMRGLPDDFDGSDKITKRQSTRPDKTWGVSGGTGLKFAGFPMAGLDVSAGLSFNNKLGVAAEVGLHPSLTISKQASDEKTSSLSYGATVGAALNFNSRNGASVTPSISFQATQNEGDYGTTASLGAGYTYSSRLGLQGMHLNAGLSMSQRNAYEKINNMGSGTISADLATLNSSISFLYPTVTPSIQNIFTRKNYNLSFSLGGELFGLNGHVKIAGYYSENRIADEDTLTTHPAYGILYAAKGEKDPKGLMDFNRLNDGVYTPGGPAIAIPLYTYDIFSISGEGTGGSFRAYKGDVGFMRDAEVRTKDDAFSLGLDLGFGNTIHGGADFSYAYTPTEAAAWKINNSAAGVLHFKDNAKNFQGTYFKNPGEKTIPDEVFQEAMGSEKLVRFKMTNIASGSPMLLPKFVKYDAGLNNIGETPALTEASFLKLKRDKRTQVISFLTAEEARRVGFNKQIFDYGMDNSKVIYSADCDKAGINIFERTATGGYRKPNHISEIDVLGTDGRKYVYGIPVYNTRQVDVTFSTDNGSNATGKSQYDPGTDDSYLNRKGRDWYRQQTETPAYTHSYLLTELISPNYVDVTGNGISEDDMGDAVKFNYSRADDSYKWRTPVGVNSASYAEGLKTDPKDDKAHYIYGTRENWLLYSIESKNMVARFYVQNDRKDCRQVTGQEGAIDNSKGMLRLDKICLYSKGELKKYANGAGAKPIKTIQFYQSYKLCEGAENSIPGFGKLTLDSIRISYNGNNKKIKSRYVFYYPADNNPSYTYNSNDRWGGYKPSSDNAAGLTNNDFPYATQDKTKTDKYAAAWTMNKILLPSGGEINLIYESDDYAYVQNRRAACMYGILGFGNTATPDLNSPDIRKLYTGSTDNDRVYIQLPEAMSGQAELKARYFEGFSQLYIKLSVVMPSGGNIPGLAGNEIIPVYADIESYGLVSPTVAWVKVKRVEGNVTPMSQQALQFLKQQLPGKAYPGYDMSEESGAKAIVLALAGIISSAGALLNGDETTLRNAGKARQTEVSQSFARLGNPYLKKLGGGLRVKKVIINDNWNKMTQQYESKYGQEYKYTKTELVNNKLTEISSGVASWEPSVGGDENSHKEIMRFLNHNKGGPYDFGAIDMPLGEALYPTPMVGYSRVEVLSIHRDTVKNLPTRQVTEFYTTREFPFKSSATSLSDPQANVKYAPSAIKQLLHLDMQKAVTQSQGFLVEMNDMNGKEKTQATYSAKDSVIPVSYTQNYYNTVKAGDNTYSFNHLFPTVKTAEGQISNAIIGRDIEMMADFRQHRSETVTTNISPNFDFFFLGVFPVPLTNLLQPTIYEGTTYRSASLLKIVNHYGMLDSVVSIDKGSMVSTKNLIYDAETGNPLLTRTNNEHNRPVYNFNYPAHMAYSGMGGAYKNIDAKFGPLTFRHGKVVDMLPELSEVLESGDELYTLAQNNNAVPPLLPCDATVGGDPWNTLGQNTEKRIWAINTSKAGSNTPQWIFMDKEGNPYNAVGANVRIIRSGHRNMLDRTIGSITSMKNPVVGNQLVFDNGTNIIQTGAATFKDHWRVDNDFYLVDSVVRTDALLPVHKKTLYPQATLNILLRRPHDTPLDHGVLFASAVGNAGYFNAEKHSAGDGWRSSRHFITSWATYNFNSIPQDATVVSGRLPLVAHNDVVVPSIVSYHNIPYSGGTNGVEDLGHINHYFNQSHRNPSECNNAFKVTRVTKNWGANPSGNTAWWKDYALNPVYSDHEGEVGIAPPGSPSASYLMEGSIPNCSDQRIDVTKMVAKMLRERSVIPPTIRLELINNNNYDVYLPEVSPVRVCFKPPAIDVYYYSCSEPDYMPGDAGVCAPVQPPPDNFGGGEPPNAVTDCESCFPQFYCTTYDHQLFCFSKFRQKKAVNPYVEGILGNWRTDSTYAYYGERNESNPDNTVDTRTGGAILNFQKFWNFASSGTTLLQRNYSASNVWVWNSTITQYNRKGYEIENTDPLGRFNSGLYGYNQQLPVAVTNNARVRETLFDGFEDYSYSTTQNCVNCKPRRFFNYDQNILSKLSADEHHTGKYSLKLTAYSSVSLTAPVTDLASADAGYGLRLKVDSTYSTVGSTGLGLKAEYFNNMNCVGTPVHTVPNSNPSFSWPATVPIPGLNNNNISGKWTGKIRITNSGNYVFRGSAFHNVKITINGFQVLNSDFGTPGNSGNSSPVLLVGGQLHDIVIEYQKLSGSGSSVIEWNGGSGTAMSVLSSSILYSPANVYATTNAVCARLDSVNVTGNALTDTFSLIRSKKMLVSAWVKEGGNDCKCSIYVNNSMAISYPGAGVADSSKQAKGSIIEGWQRYEWVTYVPAYATSVKITLNNYTSNGSPVYFDDIRVQPFNSNMKSFVYHPETLRLSGELDENNYATFYEYDDDGTLTRVKKETMEGIKTITETRSALQQTIQP